MKKSLFNVVWFVFLTCLSIVLPAYVLMTGTATLMPYVLFGAALSYVGAIGALFAIAALVIFAEKRQSIQAHTQLMALHVVFDRTPAWRSAFLVVRFVAQSVLLLSLSCYVPAASVAIGLVAALVGQGLVRSYASSVSPFKVKGSETYLNAAMIRRKSFGDA